MFLEALGLHIDSQTPKAKAELTMLMQDLFESISACGQCLFTGYAVFPGLVFTQPDHPLTAALNKAITKIGPILSLVNKNPEILFFPLSIFHYDREIKYAVGMKMTLGKFIRCGERGYTLERYVDTLFGITEKDDSLPARLTNEPEDPKDETTKVPLDKMKKAYYAVRGWSKEGVPTEATLKKLGIKKGQQ